MSDTTDTLPATEGATTRRKTPGLSGMVLAELQTVASGLGITGTTRMRKGELIEAIREKQGQSAPARSASSRSTAGRSTRHLRPASEATQADLLRHGSDRLENGSRTTGRRSRTAARGETAKGNDGATDTGDAQPSQSDRSQSDRSQSDRGQSDRSQSDRGGKGGSAEQSAATANDRDGFEGSRSSRRRRRGRDRDRYRERGGRDRFAEGEPQVSPDDVLVPVAGIVDVLDSYAFVRTSGYLPGSNDVYISLSQVRRYGLRRGDAVTGAVRQPKEGERREKFNALVRLDTINGAEADKAKERPDFNKLTPLYPQDRLRLETESSSADDPGHRPRGSDRQGPARPDRLPAQGRKDDGAAGDRERDHDEQPRGAPDGGARRRAS